MDIQNFITEFKKTFVYDLLSQTLTDEQLFEHAVDGDGVTWFKEQMRQMWDLWQAAKARADQKIKLLLCDEHLKKCESPTGVFNSQYPDEEPCLICLAKQAKAQAVLEVKPSRCVTLTCAQLREAFMFGAPDKDDQEQLETEMTISWSENGHSGKGYYCYYSDLPEEGAIFLDDVIEAQEPANESK